MIAIEMATDVSFNGMCKLDENYACQDWFDWNHGTSDYLARQNCNLRGHWDMDLDLEHSNSLSFFAVDRDSDCADNLDLPCMALELEKEVEELEFQADRLPGANSKPSLDSNSKGDSNSNSAETSSQDASTSAEICSAATNERLSAAATRASIPSLALYASEEERDELDVLQIDSDDECTMSANGTSCAPQRQLSHSDTDGLSDQDNHSAHISCADQQQQQHQQQHPAASSRPWHQDTGSSALPALPALPGKLLRNQNGPVIIVQKPHDASKLPKLPQLPQLPGCAAAQGPIIRPLGPLPTGEEAAKALGAFFPAGLQGTPVAGPSIQVTASVPASGAYPAGAYKLQPVTLRPVMLMPAKPPVPAPVPGQLPATFQPATSPPGSYERMPSSFSDTLRLSAPPAGSLERIVVAQPPAAEPAQQLAGGSSRQRQSKQAGAIKHKRDICDQQGGSPKGCKRSRHQGPARIAAAPAGHCCTQCGTQTTPVWRAGPQGPKTLCNACGVRYMKTAKKK